MALLLHFVFIAFVYVFQSHSFAHFPNTNFSRVILYGEPREPLSKRFCTTRAGKTIIIRKTQELAAQSSLVVQLRYNKFREYHSNLLRDSFNKKFNESLSLEDRPVVLKVIKNTLFEIGMINAGYRLEKRTVTLTNIFLFIRDITLVSSIVRHLVKLRARNKFFGDNLLIINGWFSDVRISPEQVEDLVSLPEMDVIYSKLAGSFRNILSAIPRSISTIPVKLHRSLSLLRDTLR